jgi:hypothetical protein
VYREVVTGSACRGGSYQGTFERLERSDAKVSRAVLRERGGGNAALLPDHLYLKQKRRTEDSNPNNILPSLPSGLSRTGVGVDPVQLLPVAPE